MKINSKKMEVAEYNNTKLAHQTKEMAKKMETVFLTELLKVMFAETSFNKDRTSSTYMTIIIPEVAKMMAETNTGIGDFLTKNIELSKTKFEESSSNSFNEVSSIKEKNEIQPDSINSENNHKEIKLSFNGRLSLPVSGRITSFYGQRIDPIDGRVKKHEGIDIAVSSGTEIRAIASGKVIFSGYAKGYGNCVIIDHGNGLQTLYAHNSKNLVKSGETITQDTVIALSGATGRATGPHLHFEVRKSGKTIDPIAMINKSEKTTII